MNICNDKYCVYIHTNKTNGKTYIGQTCQKVEQRWRKGEGYKGSHHFYNAILKYGWDGFEHEVIASNLTHSEADNFEMLLISQLNTTDENYGYNIAIGGNSPTQGRKQTTETKEKISKANSNPSEETRKKMREAKPKKPVLCIDTNIIYESITEAERQTGIAHIVISRCCRGKQKTAGGFMWRYYEEMAVAA